MSDEHGDRAPVAGTTARHTPDVVDISNARTAEEVELFAAERVTFFSDAVIAIAITLLALNLPQPGAQEVVGLDFLLAPKNRSEYLGLAISFLVIASNWVGHHRVFRYVAKVSGLATWLDIIWLFAIVLTPYTMRLLFSGPSGSTSQVAQILYAADQCVAFIAFYLMVRAIERGQMLTLDAPDHMSRIALRRTGPTVLGFLVSIPVTVLWSANAAYACWVLFPVVLTPVMLRLRHREQQLAAGSG